MADLYNILSGVSSGLGILGQEFENSRGININNTLANIKSQIPTYGSTTNSDLVARAASTPYLASWDMDRLTGLTKGQRTKNAVLGNLSAGVQGAITGLQASGGNGYAALAGAVVGQLLNGWAQGKRKRENNNALAVLNNAVNTVNYNKPYAIGVAARDIEAKQDANIMNNYFKSSAFGGPLFSEGSQIGGAIDYDVILSDLNRKDKQVASKSPTALPQLFASGGSLADLDMSQYNNGVIEINKGGSHEDNPYGGVFFGVDRKGTPNKVEQGETVYNDFAYSNRIKVPRSLRGKYNLRGDTFSDVFKYASLESKERPFDNISKNGLDDIANILAEAQEAIKEQNKMYNFAAYGGQLDNRFPDGGYIPYDRDFEDYDALYAEDSNYMKAINWLKQEANAEKRNALIEDIIAGKYGEVPSARANDVRNKWEALATDRKKGPVHNALVAWANENADLFNSPADTVNPEEELIPRVGKYIDTPITRTNPNDVPTAFDQAIVDQMYGKGLAPFFDVPQDTRNTGTEYIPGTPRPEFPDNYAVTKEKTLKVPKGKPSKEAEKIIKKAEKEAKSEEGNEEDKYDWMRVASAVAPLFGAAYTAFNYEQPPLMSYEGAAPQIGYDPIGTLLQRRVPDTRYELAQKIAQGNAMNNAIKQSIAPNRYANMLASNSQLLSSIGDTYREAQNLAFDWDKQVADFNRGTAQANQTAGLTAAQSNQNALLKAIENRIAVDKYNADRLYAYQNARDTAIGSSLSSGFENLGELAKELWAKKHKQALKDKGVLEELFT